MSQPRHTGGTPLGGRFAPSARAESDVDLGYSQELEAEIASLRERVTRAETEVEAATSAVEVMKDEFESGQWNLAHPDADWGQAFEHEQSCYERQETAERSLAELRRQLSSAEMELSEYDEALGTD